MSGEKSQISGDSPLGDRDASSYTTTAAPDRCAEVFDVVEQVYELGSPYRHITTDVPGGYRLVPLEPTQEMEQAFRLNYESARPMVGGRRALYFRDAWQAALSAAPAGKVPEPTSKARGAQ